MDYTHACSFTGHRPAKLPWGDNEQDPRCITLKENIKRAVEEAYQMGYRHFICGMAQGCDLFFCEAVLALREEHPDVTIEAAIPYADQAKGWSASEQERYRRLVARCDFETMVQQNYDRGCLHRRNRYMVDHSSLLLAAYDGTAGGTMYTVVYAMKRNIPILGIEINGFLFEI